MVFVLQLREVGLFGFSENVGNLSQPAGPSLPLWVLATTKVKKNFLFWILSQSEYFILLGRNNGKFSRTFVWGGGSEEYFQAKVQPKITPCRLQNFPNKWIWDVLMICWGGKAPKKGKNRGQYPVLKGRRKELINMSPHLPRLNPWNWNSSEVNHKKIQW